MYGICDEKYFDAIPTMTAQALASGSPQNNPRMPTAEEIAQLYHEVGNNLPNVRRTSEAHDVHK